MMKDKGTYFDDDSILRSIDEIVDPTFAEGLESVEYLRQLREG